ncbi:hypothetical protein [Flavobacterium sp.]|uniref:hypothetical protein n=1 Tax=Flavobacterium sp. TaxID=239 RepID=UPI00375013D2
MYKKNLKLLFLFGLILCNCKEQKEKSITTNNSINTVKLETSCFVKQKIINESKDFVYKYEDFEYKINQNNESKNNLIIDDKEYSTNLILESADIHFHYYKCNGKKIFLVEGADYYSSTFYVYYYENDNLFYSGTFSIDQPNVENDGVLSKRFEMFANNNQIEIQSFIDNKEHKKFTFKERTKILLSEIKSIANVENEIKGLWSVTCENELTLLDISNNIGYLSLNSDNAIYINVNVTKGNL